MYNYDTQQMEIGLLRAFSEFIYDGVKKDKVRFIANVGKEYKNLPQHK